MGTDRADDVRTEVLGHTVTALQAAKIARRLAAAAVDRAALDEALEVIERRLTVVHHRLHPETDLVDLREQPIDST